MRSPVLWAVANARDIADGGAGVLWTLCSLQSSEDVTSASSVCSEQGIECGVWRGRWQQRPCDMCLDYFSAVGWQWAVLFSDTKL